MAKIIKLGELPEDKVKKVTCRNCHSVLEVKQSEWQSDPGEYCLYIECPVCKKLIYQSRR